MTLAELHDINEWRWQDVIFDRPALKSPSHAYTAVDSHDAIAAYCSFATGAAIGLNPAAYVAVAGGIRPDLLGSGNGRSFMSAVLDLGRRTFSDKTLAAIVKDSNQRSLVSALHAGFVVLGRASDDEGVIIVDGVSRVRQP